MINSYFNILNQLPNLICEIGIDRKIKFANICFSTHFNVDIQKIKEKNISELLNERDLLSFSKINFECPIIKFTNEYEKNQNIIYIEWTLMGAFTNQKITSYYLVGNNITDSKLLEKFNETKLTQLTLAFEKHKAIMLFIEPESGKIIYSNPAATIFYGYSSKELHSMTIQEINMLGAAKVKELRERANKKSQRYFTFPHKLKSGEIRIVDVYSSPIKFGDKDVLFSIIFDVTDKEDAMKEIKRLAYYDHLTNVYNRRYFEETFEMMNKKANYPLAIIIGDLNGLKLINDSYGHTYGDYLLKEAAANIKKYLPNNALLARIGGDEFAILLTSISSIKVSELANLLEKKLERKVKTNNSKIQLYLSISFGYSVQNEKTVDLDQMMKEAEDIIYSRKYYSSKSMRSNMVKAMLSTLFQKSEREQKHSKRVGIYCAKIAENLGWEKERVDRVSVAGSLHDIGKIGISESILNKPSKLSRDEWKLMKQHPAKGAAILEEINEYKDIANIVASHHERWDGKGYSTKRKSEEIPIESRIISVADAYDAMVNSRTYRKSICAENAIKELRRCAGSQFDPLIVDVFIDNVLNEAISET